MAIALLDFIKNVLYVAKQALGNHAGKPESGGLPCEAHIVAHCLQKKGHTFTELVDRIGLMPEVYDRLGIHPDALPIQRRSITLSTATPGTSGGRCCAPVALAAFRHAVAEAMTRINRRCSHSSIVAAVSDTSCQRNPPTNRP